MRLHPILAFAALVSLGACTETHDFWGKTAFSGPARCSDGRFSIYFAEGSDRLTEPARQVIAARARVLRTCRIREVRVIGLSDASGAAESNLSLSQKRARRVAEALAAEGLPRPVFEVRGAGAWGATRDGREIPVRRRAEVVLAVSPPPVQPKTAPIV
jgi:hypothetical protein